MSHTVILRLRDRYQQTGNVRERGRSGRPRVLTRQQVRLVSLAARRDRTVTAKDIRAQLRVAANVNVSDQTIRNRLHAANLWSRRAQSRSGMQISFGDNQSRFTVSSRGCISSLGSPAECPIEGRCSHQMFVNHYSVVAERKTNTAVPNNWGPVPIKCS